MTFHYTIGFNENSQDLINNTTNCTLSFSTNWVDGVNLTKTYTCRIRILKVTGTSSDIDWNNPIYEDNYTYSINVGNQVEGSKFLFSRTFDVPHLADGTRTIMARVEITDTDFPSSGYYPVTRNITLTPINRFITLTEAPNFNDESSATIKYINPPGEGCTSLQAGISFISNGSPMHIAYRDVPKDVEGTYTFNFTEAERQIFYENTPTVTAKVVYFYMKQVVGGNTYYSKLAKTLWIVNCNPVILPTVEDVDSVSLGFTGDKNKIVKYVSDAQFNFNATGVKGASIKSYLVSCGNDTATVSSGTLADVKSADFTFYVRDSRGKTTTVTVNKTLVDYVRLTCSFPNSQVSTDGRLTFTAQGNYFNGSFGSTANTLTAQYRMKEQGTDYGAWANLTITLSGNTYKATADFTGLDYLKVYVFQVRINDKIISLTPDDVTISSRTIFDWGKNDFSINVDTAINGNLDLNGNIDISGTTTFQQTLTAGKGLSVTGDAVVSGNVTARNLTEVVLYYNDLGGSSAEITLSETTANFKYIEIYYTDNNGKGVGFTKIYQPNGKTTVDLSLIEATSTSTIYCRVSRYSISNNKITPVLESSGYTTITSSSVKFYKDRNLIKIHRVVGYR